MNRIYFIRHGENKANITKEFSYRKVDYPLTEKGQIQSKQTAEYFINKPIDTIFTSPLKRAIETANYIGIKINKEPKIIEEFCELNVGDMEDMPPDEKSWGIYQKVAAEWLSGNVKFSFPNGENYNDVINRFTRGLKSIINPETDQNIIVVGHGSIFTVGIINTCKINNINEFLRIQNHNCSISEITLDYHEYNFNCSLIRWSDHSHLNGSASILLDGLPGYGKV